MPTLLVSDIHLHPSRLPTARLFQEFLAGPAHRTAELYILGDLFDAWIGDDDLDEPFNAGICQALRACAEAGTRIRLLHGNRDFLLGAGFAAAAGVELIAEPTVAAIGGVPTLLLHGDTLCADDYAYQEFRAQVRSPQWQRDFLAAPLAERREVAKGLRARSENEKRTKSMTLMDVNEAAVRQAFADHRVARIIHGHTHRQGHHIYAEGERWVLPEWDGGGGALACDEAGCRWLAFPRP